MNSIIVADIGGTYARFGIAPSTLSKTLTIDLQATLTCADFPSFIECANHYLKMLPTLTLQNACFAFAGPVMGDEVIMTNNNWRILLPEIKTALKLEHLEVINDFAAQACAIPHLESSELSVIKPGKILPESSKTVLGPGTGLGIGALIHCNGTWHPLAGEGGHIGFSYPNILGSDIFLALHAKHNFLSLETLLSGNGLVNIYRAVCEVHKADVKDYDESDISRIGVRNSDPLCQQTLRLFCEILGAAAGDFALINGSKGGVYLAGGILPRIEDFLKTSNFSSTFNQKGKMTNFLDNIPVFLVKKDNPALYGAASWLLNYIEANNS